MPIPPKLKSLYKQLNWADKSFILIAVLYGIVALATNAAGWKLALFLLLIVSGFIEGIRLLIKASRHVIWRLRNRLIVTYLFIAVVPLVLVFLLVGAFLWAGASQVAVYLVSSEVQRRIDTTGNVSKSILDVDTGSRAALMRQLAGTVYKDELPGIQTILRTRADGVDRYPSNATVEPPPAGWGDVSGLVWRERRLFAWSHVKLVDGDFTVMAPLSRRYLSDLVPGLALVNFTVFRRTGNSVPIRRVKEAMASGESDASAKVPPRVNRFDISVSWSSEFPVAMWETPGVIEIGLLDVLSRPSAVSSALFARKTDALQGVLPTAVIVLAVTFLIVELIALVIGISMTRTITNAVHHLYIGTQRVMRGDFSHRIEVKGKDQLADLGNSFNQMTSRIEELLVVAKEKERLQSELEIASEVQNQLYPKKVPQVRTLRLTAVCKPARMVSGDYFDYDFVHGGQVALAIGDVAGKGISAALLMATVSSSLRAELRGCVELASAAGNGSGKPGMSTSKLVSHLNSHLYAYTSPEKYATFYLGIYDEESSVLTYTNAGHLPPILVRNGQAERLNVDGTVVGAFPFAMFDESRVTLQKDDLLVCFTDGVSEPENEYGEMFGEDRLVELVTRNSHRGEDDIVSAIVEAVERWTGTQELQDDLTLMLVRRM